MKVTMAMGRTRGTGKKTGCGVESALSVIGGRWKGVVLYCLLSGKTRFSALQRQLPNCSQRMLTIQLRELETDGLVKRTVYAEVPPHVDYELTAFGRSLEPVLEQLRHWGNGFKNRLEREA
jgi:DNA-binding HxlR family transcriptional regulator